MRLYCRSLPEDHRRRYAAIEALKIGYGGVAYVSRVLGLSRPSRRLTELLLSLIPSSRSINARKVFSVQRQKSNWYCCGLPSVTT